MNTFEISAICFLYILWIYAVYKMRRLRIKASKVINQAEDIIENQKKSIQSRNSDIKRLLKKLEAVKKEIGYEKYHVSLGDLAVKKLQAKLEEQLTAEEKAVDAYREHIDKCTIPRMSAIGCMCGLKEKLAALADKENPNE